MESKLQAGRNLQATEGIVYEFAPFVFYADTMSLKRHGHSVRLSEQTARVLSEFVQHSGELITRKELYRALWPDGIFTESDQGLNNIISKLRTSLRDDPKKPRYIETIPKRGYQFLAPVTIVCPVADPDVADTSPESFVEPDAAKFPVPVIDEPDVTYSAPYPERELETSITSLLVSNANLEVLAAMPKAEGSPAHPALWGHRWWLTALVLIAIVSSMTIAVWRHLHQPVQHPAAEISLAVAPFDVRNVDPAKEQLVESFRLDLIDGLSALPGISVRAAHSVTTGTNNSAGHTAPQKLDVDAILYTQLTQSGTSYDLHVELVRYKDSAHLQSWHYSGPVAQLGSIREQIQSDVFSYWKGTGVGKQVDIGGTENPVAYELYLRARYHAHQRDPNSVLEAVKEYQEAIDQDPGFAKAYSGLALATFLSFNTKTDHDKAEVFAAKAVTLAPNLADAHAILGNLYFRHDWRFADGEQELRRAIALDPNEPSYRVWLAFNLGNLGRFQEGPTQIDIAKKDDPYWTPIYHTEVYLGIISNQPERMIKASQMLMEIRPDSADSYDTRGWVKWTLGHYAEAIADWRMVGEIDGDPVRVALEDRGLAAFKTGGEKGYARTRLKSVTEYPEGVNSDNDFVAAEWFAFAGDQENCLKELTRLVDVRDENAIGIAVNPAYASLHRDPRFQKLLKRVGLPSTN